MIKLNKTDEVVSIIAYDHNRNKFVLIDNPDAWLNGKVSNIKVDKVGEFHRGLLQLIKDCLETP